MTDTLLTFKIFNDKEIAQDFAEILKQNDISYFIEEDALVFDPSYANNELNKDYRLRLRPQDFERANKIFEDYYQKQLDKVDKDYYLYDFTDDELQEIVAKPDEWGHLDYQLAQKLLSERGKDIKPEETKKLKEERLKDLSKPERVKNDSIVGAYILSVILFPVGLFIGWYWGYSKKTLPTGQRVYEYDRRSRKHGKRIFAIGIILPLLSLLVKIIAAFVNNQ